MADVGHTPIGDVGIEPNVTEPSNHPPTRRSNDRAKRQALQSKKSDLINEIRGIVGVRDGASGLEVLNAGAGFWPIAIVGLVTHHPYPF